VRVAVLAEDFASIVMSPMRSLADGLLPSEADGETGRIVQKAAV